MGRLIDRDKLSDADKLRLHAATLELLKALEELLTEKRTGFFVSELNISDEKQSPQSTNNLDQDIK